MLNHILLTSSIEAEQSIETLAAPIDVPEKALIFLYIPRSINA